MISTLLPHRLRSWGVYFLNDRVVYFGGSEAPILYMTLMYYDVNFWILMNFFYDDRIYLYLHVCKMYVCDTLMVCGTNANLTHSLHMSQQLD